MINHTTVSFVKSFLRVVGYVCLGFGELFFAALLLTIAELGGVIEELV